MWLDLSTELGNTLHKCTSLPWCSLQHCAAPSWCSERVVCGIFFCIALYSAMRLSAFSACLFQQQPTSIEARRTHRLNSFTALPSVTAIHKQPKPTSSTVEPQAARLVGIIDDAAASSDCVVGTVCRGVLLSWLKYQRTSCDCQSALKEPLLPTGGVVLQLHVLCKV